MDQQKLMSGEFKFLVGLAKAVKDGNDLFVEGIASDTGLDLQGQVISVSGQEAMAKWAQTGKVVLGGEADHRHIAFDDDLGNLVDGEVKDNGEFYIRAKLDNANPRAVGLYDALESGKQLGLSVFGRVTNYDDGGSVPVINGVELTRVMVTPSPANPRTWLENVAKAFGRPHQEGVMDDDAQSAQAGLDVAKAIKDVDEWDGSEARWDSADDYCDACLIDVNEAAGNEDKVKGMCMLPVREPGDGADTYVRQAVYAAAGAHGVGAVERPDGVSEDDWSTAVKAAASAIITAYDEMGEVAPDSVYEVAGKEAPSVGDVDKADGAVEGAGADEGTDDSAGTDARGVAKGLLRDRLAQMAVDEARMAGFSEQLQRISDITLLCNVLWDVAMELYWANEDNIGALTPDDAAALLSEAIEEFKAEVVAKAEAETGSDVALTAVSEGDGAEDADAADAAQADAALSAGATEGAVQDVSADEGYEVPRHGKALKDIAQAFTRDVFEGDVETVADEGQAQAGAGTQGPDEHQAVTVAQTFAEVVKALMSDKSMDAGERREAIQDAMVAAATEIDKALPEDAGQEDAPVWAQKLMSRIDELEKAVTRVNVGAGSAGDSAKPGDTDNLTLPARKSMALRPSAVVDKPRSLRQVALALMTNGGDPLIEP